ncbi:MAG: LLM class flavin-dependent oxidoreductase, partial [Acetobacteraceae bacterium]|nr:LLM class flavin-dependent oxidoreductase [Acetobacteraceae bacterium]
VSFSGKYFQVEELVALPRPVQKPGLPIMVAGAGPRLLSVAARYADIINFAPRPPTTGRTATGSIGFGLTVAGMLELVREAAGDRFDDLELATFSIRPVVTDATDLSDVMDAFAAEYNTSQAVAATIPATLAGSVEALVERLQQQRDELGLSYRIIGGSGMEAFAPVVARLKGT